MSDRKLEPNATNFLATARTACPRNGVVVTRQCRNGIFSFLPCDDPIGRSLREYGEWAQGEIDFLLRLIGPGGVVLDVGANIGTHTVAFARHVGHPGRVYAFEPQIRLFELLRTNVHQNSLDNVQLLNLGVADVAGEMILQARDYSQRGNFGAVALRPLIPRDHTTDGDRVRVTTLDHCALDRCDLIKVDVEGMELQVLLGARKTVSAFRPIIYVECNTAEAGWLAICHMKDHQYEAFLHQVPAFNPSNYFRNNENFFYEAHESNLLFVPSERLAASGGSIADGARLLRVFTLDDLARALLDTPRWGDLALGSVSPRAMVRSIAMLKEAVVERDGEIARLKDAVAERDSQIAAILRSASWRITRPLRTAKRTLARFAETRGTLISLVIRRLYHAAPLPFRWKTRLTDSFYRNPASTVRHLVRPQNAYATPAHRDLDTYAKMKGPCAPNRQAWLTLAELRKARSDTTSPPIVDVIIPVYMGADETLQCIYRALDAPVKTPHDVIVIDDAGPDPALTHELARLATAGLFTLIRNERNVGFVRTVNKGMCLHADRDVVLLNSDTEVYGDWLDRLRAAAYQQARIGSVTPLSNNAEIFSYPSFVRNNDMQLEIGDTELDRLAATVNAGLIVEVPTAGGFCMYIRRDCLAEVGLFDARRFGRGYGEENDFCLRATERGWCHVLAGDVFVRHYGGVSFQGEKHQRIVRAVNILRRRFPHYHTTVQTFIARDPAQSIRRRVDIARLKHRVANRAVLFITHRRGGGTERHVQDMRRWLEREGVTVFLLRSEPERPELVTLTHQEVPCTPNLRAFNVKDDIDAFVATLAEIGIDHIHVHHLADFDNSAPDWVRTAADMLGIGYDVTIHDYLPICPRITLIDASGVYCGEPEPSVCEACVAVSGSSFGAVSVRHWRDRYGALLRGARRVFVPNVDVSRRLQRYFPDVTFSLRPHPEAVPTLRDAGLSQHNAGEPLRVAIIGAIGPHKGSKILLACASDALLRRLPIHFIVFGHTDVPSLAHLPNVMITGPYIEDEIYPLLQRHRCHLALFPAVWPETYSYTLSVALRARLFPVAFDLGAIAERIREIGWGELLPTDWMRKPKAINERLLTVPVTPAPPEAVVPAWEDLYPSCTRSYYGGIPRRSR